MEDKMVNEQEVQVSEQHRLIKTVMIGSINDLKNISKKVNDAASEIVKEGGKVICYSSQCFGLSPITLIYNIVYDTKAEKQASENSKNRFIETIVFNSSSDIKHIELLVNAVAADIEKQGGKVVCYLQQSYGISPMNLVYNIVYETNSTEPLTLTEQSKTKKK